MNRIFICNLEKYNEGKLVGGWYELGQDDTVLEKFLREVVEIDNEQEYFISDTDLEDIELDIPEYENIEGLNIAFREYESLYRCDRELVQAILELGIETNLQEAIDTRKNFILLENVLTDYDLGYYYAELSGCYVTADMGNLANYIDYQAFGKDIDIESEGGFTSYGYLMKN